VAVVVHGGYINPKLWKKTSLSERNSEQFALGIFGYNRILFTTPLE
jgi:hypothetical protein